MGDSYLFGYKLLNLYTLPRATCRFLYMKVMYRQFCASPLLNNWTKWITSFPDLIKRCYAIFLEKMSTMALFCIDIFLLISSSMVSLDWLFTASPHTRNTICNKCAGAVTKMCFSQVYILEDNIMRSQALK